MSIKGLAKCISQLSANVCSMSQKGCPAIPALHTLVCPWHQMGALPQLANPALASRSHLRAEEKTNLVLLKKKKSHYSLDCCSKTYLKLYFSLLSKNFLIVYLKTEHILSKGLSCKASYLFILHLSFYKLKIQKGWPCTVRAVFLPTLEES